jgi:hypothetical protein
MTAVVTEPVSLRERATAALLSAKAEAEAATQQEKARRNLALGRYAEECAREILGATGPYTFSQVTIDMKSDGEDQVDSVDLVLDNIPFRVVLADRYSGLYIVDHYEDTGREFLRRVHSIEDVGAWLASFPKMEPKPAPAKPKSEKDLATEIAEDIGVIPGQAPEWFLQYQMRVSHHVGKLHTRINEVAAALKDTRALVVPLEDR